MLGFGTKWSLGLLFGSCVITLVTSIRGTRFCFFFYSFISFILFVWENFAAGSVSAQYSWGGIFFIILCLAAVGAGAYAVYKYRIRVCCSFFENLEKLMFSTGNREKKTSLCASMRC